MADRNIDLKIRKPRQTRGTPLYWQRNIAALAVVGFGGLTWLLYDIAWMREHKYYSKLWPSHDNHVNQFVVEYFRQVQHVIDLKTSAEARIGLWPASDKLRAAVHNGTFFQLPEGWMKHRERQKFSEFNPVLNELAEKVIARQEKKYEESDKTPKTWLEKLISSTPDT